MDFSEICDLLILPNDENLEVENKQLLKNLYEKIDKFDDSWGHSLQNNVITLINHPEWKEIQDQAAIFLEKLSNEQ